MDPGSPLHSTQDDETKGYAVPYLSVIPAQAGIHSARTTFEAQMDVLSNRGKPLKTYCVNRLGCRVLVRASPIRLIGLVIQSTTPGTRPGHERFRGFQ